MKSSSAHFSLDAQESVGADTEPDSAPIRIRGLTKTFGGVVAVNGLDLKVERGSVYGLIGRNGAGKTTTLRLLAGLLRADSGEALLLGQDWWQASPLDRQRVAYVAQSGRPPDWMTLTDLSRYSAHFFERWDHGLAHELAERWELPWNRPLGRLSGGHQRLASLLSALSARPDVLILDEPAAGLDPVVRKDLLRSLVEALMRTDGCTVVLSTHLLADVERLATHVGIMEHGRIVGSGSVEDWQRTMRRVQVVFPGREIPTGVEIPGVIREQRLGPVLTGILRISSVHQLDEIRAMEGVRVNVFPLTLEELFVEWFERRDDDRTSATPLPSGIEGFWGRSMSLAGVTPDKRVGNRFTQAVAPAGREVDASGSGPTPYTLKKDPETS
jgi:ABC-2 type transport system ATP-binding protein